MKKQSTEDRDLDNFVIMFEIFDELPNDKDRSEACGLIAQLYKHEKPAKSSGKPYLPENDFFETNPNLTQAQHDAQNERALKIYNYLHKLCLDRKLSKKFTKCLRDLLLNCVRGYGYMLRITSVPKKHGRPTEYKKKEVISKLVDLYCTITKSKELAYEKVADLLACISLKISPSTVRAHYEDATGRRKRTKK